MSKFKLAEKMIDRYLEANEPNKDDPMRPGHEDDDKDPAEDDDKDPEKDVTKHESRRIRNRR